MHVALTCKLKCKSEVLLFHTYNQTANIFVKLPMAVLKNMVDLKCESIKVFSMFQENLPWNWDQSSSFNAVTVNCDPVSMENTAYA